MVSNCSITKWSVKCICELECIWKASILRLLFLFYTSSHALLLCVLDNEYVLNKKT